ncbi:hypothetical protein [Methylobacterium nigriterrae]|uniref:hypothetical protein n=1 Tax=Methylobacterium nigriterrae TaxID=3127512 RepID=UPI003013FBAB
MSAFFGSDGSFVLQFAVIFLVILALLTAGVLLVRRFSGKGLTLSAKSTPRGRQPRLGIVDVYELDRQRQLILLRRDNVEHLLLVGGPNDVVIERHIQRGLRAAADPLLRPEPMAEPTAEFEPRRPEPPLFDPAFAMPMVVPAAVPGSQAAPPVTHPLDDAALATDAEFEEVPAQSTPEPAPRRADVPPKRPLSRTTPPLVNPRPDVASERARSEPVFTAAPPEPPLRAAAPPVTAPAEPRAVDASILSDMARQLEIALARPSSAVTPPPGSAKAAARPAPGPAPMPPPPPVTAAPVDRPVTDPMAAAMAASQAPIERDGSPEMPARAAPPIPQQPAPAPSPEPRPFLPDPPDTAPTAKTETAKIETAKTETAKTETAKTEPVASQPAAGPAPAKPAQPANPFSVEEIEAEFARLLGRPLDKKN